MVVSGSGPVMAICRLMVFTFNSSPRGMTARTIYFATETVT
jgi:hypothetical protein